MKIPKKIKINNREISVSIVKKIPGEQTRTLGVFDMGSRRIYLRADQNKDEMLYTLLHEINHAILWTRGAHNLLTEKNEEVIVDSFADGFLNLIRNNKKLIKDLGDTNG